MRRSIAVKTGVIAHKESGSSATDFGTDVTDVTEVRRKKNYARCPRPDAHAHAPNQ